MFQTHFNGAMLLFQRCASKKQQQPITENNSVFQQRWPRDCFYWRTVYKVKENDFTRVS